MTNQRDDLHIQERAHSGRNKEDLAWPNNQSDDAQLGVIVPHRFQQRDLLSFDEFRACRKVSDSEFSTLFCPKFIQPRVLLAAVQKSH